MRRAKTSAQCDRAKNPSSRKGKSRRKPKPAHTKAKGEALPKKPRKTYKQEWRPYTAAQTNEKRLFGVLLRELCGGVEEPLQTFGRPRALVSDMLFSVVCLVYEGVPGRRLMTDLGEAHAKGYLTRPPHFNTITKYLDQEMLTAYLRDLITQSSLPLKAVETSFAVDSSGFSSGRFVRWFNKRYGKEQDNHDWIKAHIMVGTTTHTITAVEVSGRHAHDSPFFKTLVNATALNFKLSEVTGDKAYSSRANLRLVKKHGGEPYIAFKDNARGDGKCEVWNKVFHYYSLHKEEYMKHYHRRSNVESVFSAVKRRFGEHLPRRTDTAQINELLCKLLCHNICVLIQSMFELGIDVTLWSKS